MARTTTKAPAPKAKLANPRNEALARMGKAELLKTVKTLDLRVTKLLNCIAVLQRGPVDTERVIAARPDTRLSAVNPTPACNCDDARNGPAAIAKCPVHSDMGRHPDAPRFPWEQ